MGLFFQEYRVIVPKEQPSYTHFPSLFNSTLSLSLSLFLFLSPTFIVTRFYFVLLLYHARMFLHLMCLLSLFPSLRFSKSSPLGYGYGLQSSVIECPILQTVQLLLLQTQLKWTSALFYCCRNTVLHMCIKQISLVWWD